MSTKYVVIKNPQWDEVAVVEANGPQQAIKRAANGDEAVYVAVPLRNTTVITAELPPLPPAPVLAFSEEADAGAWLLAPVPEEEPFEHAILTAPGNAS